MKYLSSIVYWYFFRAGRPPSSFGRPETRGRDMPLMTGMIKCFNLLDLLQILL